jgi:uncharacterized phage protein (TIGR01671 family)
MRQIKFRAWDGVDYMTKPFTLLDIQNGKIQFASFITAIMQFTGLHDKNRKEIYESDRVLTKEGYEGKVKFSHQRCGFYIEYQIPPLRAVYTKEFNCTYGDGETYMDETIEVIGNIYENKQS